MRTTQSVTSSHVDLIVRLLAGTSTSLLCYKKNEMLEEFFAFYVAMDFYTPADFSEYWSAIALKALPYMETSANVVLVTTLCTVCMNCTENVIFLKLVRLVYELLYFGIHWSICSLLHRAHKCS